METLDIIVDSVIVESVERQGRSKAALGYILMDRVFEWQRKGKKSIEVIHRPSGLPYYYE